MHNLNIVIIGSPFLYGILTLISIGLAGWILFSKKNWVKQLGFAKRFLIALVIVIFFQLSLLQITTPVKQSAVTRFDAPLVDQSTIPEKVTKPQDNVSKAQSSFDEQLKKSKQENAQ
ncbi:hypothetical protein RVBP21_1880 [Pseudomonas phage BRkr]|nr:hypothetical protein RVBP21_1880 [Pseudomonas phage BRkr]